MKIQQLPFYKITFEEKVYEQTLKDSLMRMGIGFPIQVKKYEDHYECIDGHKRLSAIADILQEQPNHKLQLITAILINEARTSSGTAKNHH